MSTTRAALLALVNELEHLASLDKYGEATARAIDGIRDALAAHEDAGTVPSGETRWTAYVPGTRPFYWFTANEAFVAILRDRWPALVIESVEPEDAGTVIPARCEGRYPVQHRRDEPFEVTYRCGLVVGHEGPHRAEPIDEPTRDRLQPMPEDAGATAALSDIDLATLVILAESAVKSNDEPTYPAMLAALRELQQRRSQPSPPRVLSREAVEQLRYRDADHPDRLGAYWVGWNKAIDAVLRLCPADAPAQETTPEREPHCHDCEVGRPVEGPGLHIHSAFAVKCPRWKADAAPGAGEQPT